MSGIMSITGEPDRRPVKVGLPMTDLITAMWDSFGGVSALYKRELTISPTSECKRGSFPGPLILTLYDEIIVPGCTLQKHSWYSSCMLWYSSIWGRFAESCYSVSCFTQRKTGCLARPELQINRNPISELGSSEDWWSIRQLS